MIMMRTLHRDLRRYNDLESKEEAQEESGWKLVHGDVFRPPPRAGLLAVYLGTGVQVIGHGRERNPMRLGRALDAPQMASGGPADDPPFDGPRSLRGSAPNCL